MKGNDAEVVGVVEGQTFKLWCEVVVDQDIDSKVTIMWKHEEMVLQADDIRVRYDQNMNITMKKSRIGMLKTSYSTELSVTSADKSYEGVYSCSVEWSVLEEPVERRYMVEVIIPARLQSSVSRVEVREGEEARSPPWSWCGRWSRWWQWRTPPSNTGSDSDTSSGPPSPSITTHQVR